MNDNINQSAIEEGKKMAETYLQVLTHSVQTHLNHLTQNPECQQQIASKFNEVFINDTEEVVNDYSNGLYEELKHE